MNCVLATAEDLHNLGTMVFVILCDVESFVQLQYQRVVNVPVNPDSLSAVNSMKYICILAQCIISVNLSV